jgi:Tfp pilus assembly protein PilZ
MQTYLSTKVEIFNPPWVSYNFYFVYLENGGLFLLLEKVYQLLALQSCQHSFLPPNIVPYNERNERLKKIIFEFAS